MKKIANICLNVYRETMFKTIDNGMREIGGVITHQNEFKYTKQGHQKMIEPHCEPGFLADWHTHPPYSVMRSPKEDIYFLPPSEADLYTSLLNGALGHNKYSVVFSVEGVYVIKIRKTAIDKFRNELEKNKIDLDNENLQKCDYVLKPDVKNGFFYGFKKSAKFPYLSQLVGTRIVTKILMYEKSFDEGFKKYCDHFETLGIKCRFYKPDDLIKQHK